MQPLPRRLFAVASAVALTAGLLSVSTAPAAEAAGPTPTSKVEKRRSKAVKTPKLTWYNCYGYARCATVRVPLDYDKPKGKKVELALLKVPAKNQKKKIGTLFVNPGGPGGPAPRSPTTRPDFFSPAVTDRFDVVGFDPRGVAFSRNVKCFSVTAQDCPVPDKINSRRLPVRGGAGEGLHQGLRQARQGLRDDRKAADRGDVDRRGRPGHGPAAPRGGRQEADLPRLLLRQLPRRGVRQPVPGPGAGPGHRRCPGPRRVGRHQEDPEHTDRRPPAAPPKAPPRPSTGLSCSCDQAGETRCTFAAGNPVANFEKIAQRLRKAPLVEIDEETGDRYVTTYADFVGITLEHALLPVLRHRRWSPTSPATWPS